MTAVRMTSGGRLTLVRPVEVADLAGPRKATGRVKLSEGLAYGVTAVLSAALGFVRAPLYTRWFKPAVYGDFALVSAGAGLLSSIVLAVFSNVLYRHYDRERRAGRVDTFLSTVAAGATGSLALVGFAAWVAGRKVGLGDSAAVAWLPVLTGIATFQGLVSQVNRMEHQAVAFVVGKLVDPVWQLVGPLLFFALGLSGFPALVSTAVVAGTGSLLVAAAWAWPILRQVNLTKTDRRALKAALAYGVPLVPLALAAWVISSSNRYVIQHFLGSEATGIFSMGYSLAFMPIGLLSSVLVMTIGPVVWEQLNLQGRGQALQLVRRTSTLFLAIAFPSALGLSLLADRIVGILFSEAYAQAAAVMLPVVLGSVLAGLYSFLVKPWELHEATGSVPLYVGAGALVNLGVNLWLVPRLGIVGAAWGSLVAYTVVAGLMILNGYRQYRVWLIPPWRDTASIAGGCGVMVMGLVTLRPVLAWPGAWGLAAIIVAGAITYTIALMAMGLVLKCELLGDLKGASLQTLRQAFGRVVGRLIGLLDKYHRG